MVLKGTKRSLRTGNTVRNIADRQSSRRSSSVIVRHVTHAKGRQQTDEADDSYLPADAVEFSLNKKGRWNLPEVIENDITNPGTGDSAVALLRRHRINRQNDCLSVVACHGAVAGDSAPAAVFERKKARRKTYCNGLNILHNGRGKSTKETRKKKVVSTKKDLADRKRQTADDASENEEVNTRSEVRYDVFYPLPATSSLRFQPKFSVSRASHQGSADNERPLLPSTNVKPSKGSHQRHRHVDYEDFYGEEDYYDDWINGEEENFIPADEYDYSGSQAAACSDGVYLDVMEQALQVALLRSLSTAGKAAGKKRPRSKKERKGCFFYSPETENEFDSCLEDGQSVTSTESGDSTSSVTSESTVIKVAPIPSAIVELSQEATRPQSLSEQYGSRYMEAACSPRRIIVEITDRVQASLTKLAGFRDVFVPSLDLTTYIIFTYISPSEQKQEPQDGCSISKDNDENLSVSAPEQRSACEEKYDLYLAQLNMNCMAEGLPFSLPENARFNNIEGVLDQVLNLLTTLTPQSLVRHPREASVSILKSRLAPDFSVLAEVNGWKASSVSLLNEREANTLPVGFPRSPLQHRNDYDQDEHNPSVDSLNLPQNQPSDIIHKEQALLPKDSDVLYCHICFTEIFPSSPQGPFATALTGCQHWFCDGCWQVHLAVGMQENGSRKLQCPEFRCGVEVDLATLLSLLPVRNVLVQQRRLAEVKVMRTFLCKWCPNPHCGRVVKLAASPSKVLAEPTSMSCPCGQRFCFRCHSDPHWPLSCEDLAQYRAVLQKQGDLLEGSQTTVIVRGKPCPACHRFIEKLGGCPHMVCLCGHQFWWCCRRPASEKHNCPSWFRVTDHTNTRKKVIKHNPLSQPDESSWLVMAAQYRSVQRTAQAKKDYRRVEQLRRHLLCLSAKGVDVGVPLTPPEESKGMEAAHPALLKPHSATSPANALRMRPKGKGRSRDRAGGKLQKTSSISSTTTTTTVNEQTRQCITQTTCRMLKLKMELNSVLENTAVLLHFQQQNAGESGRLRSEAIITRVKDTVDVLQGLVTSLDTLMGAQGRETARVLPWFRNLQRNAKDTLNTLTSLLHR